MKRRVLLGTLPFALSGCLSSLPGPDGPRNPPTEPEDDPRAEAEQKPLVAGDFRFKRTDDETLRVVLTVTNRTDTKQTGTLTGTLTLKGETYERTNEVTVGGDETVETELVYDEVGFEAFRDADSFDFSATIE
ncbi:hypothetical protein SAMN04487948_10621 [Halogranum amylolyticum]|uniref:Uncharacterized protein n=1 Tax=Halogranum amylolyticum TaxID=660520 RepID=A0A1H8T4R1_9EURY|nr:hypothetical protein [Halogranum amylolyticum]SEO86010.1 hypothetical protein SAMN04487948_10621 [Halogranum amylolyticum]